jgi:hypothetical protein
MSYEKKDFLVEVNGLSIAAMAYVMTEGKINCCESQAPDGVYVESIRKGYRDEKLDETTLDRALNL